MKKVFKHIFKTSTILVWTAVVFIGGFVFGYLASESNQKYALEHSTQVQTVSSISDVLSPSPEMNQEKTNQNSLSQAKNENNLKYGETVKLDDHTSASKFAPDDHMSSVSELNTAMNNYRLNHGLPTVNFDPLLCNIAQIRANQLLTAGKLDYHAGFSDLAHNQQSYNSMDEVIFGGVNKVAGVHIVEWGWDKSLTGHHEAISDPKWHNGCAGIAGLFAVYIFGSN